VGWQRLILGQSLPSYRKRGLKFYGDNKDEEFCLNNLNSFYATKFSVDIALDLALQICNCES